MCNNLTVTAFTENIIAKLGTHSLLHDWT